MKVHKTFRRCLGRLTQVHFTSCVQVLLSPNQLSRPYTSRASILTLSWRWSLSYRTSPLICRAKQFLQSNFTWFLCFVWFIFFRDCRFLHISSHENKKCLSPFYHKKFFDRKWMFKTPIGCLTFIFHQKYFLG